MSVPRLSSRAEIPITAIIIAAASPTTTILRWVVRFAVYSDQFMSLTKSARGAKHYCISRQCTYTKVQAVFCPISPWPGPSSKAKTISALGRRTFHDAFAGVPFAPESRHSALRQTCPLGPIADIGASFDYLICARDKRQGDRDTERLGGSEIDRHFQRRWLNDRQLGRLLTFENPSNVDTCLVPCVGPAAP